MKRASIHPIASLALLSALGGFAGIPDAVHEAKQALIDNKEAELLRKRVSNADPDGNRQQRRAHKAQARRNKHR